MNAITRAIRRRGLLGRRDLQLARDADISRSTLGRFVRVGPRAAILRSSIGDRSYLGPDCSVVDASIGKYCSLASAVHVGLGSHPPQFVSTHPVFYLRRPSLYMDFADRDYHHEFAKTKIGHDVWIGLRAAVRDGVTIADGAIVGAGAVVTRDVPPYAIVAGVPARLVRLRFPEDTIRRLLATQWWDRSDEWLRAHFRSFHDIESFLGLCERA